VSGTSRKLIVTASQRHEPQLHSVTSVNYCEKIEDNHILFCSINVVSFSSSL